jgi:hypothetical protein
VNTDRVMLGADFQAKHDAAGVNTDRVMLGADF